MNCYDTVDDIVLLYKIFTRENKSSSTRFKRFAQKLWGLNKIMCISDDVSSLLGVPF